MKSPQLSANIIALILSYTSEPLGAPQIVAVHVLYELPSIVWYFTKYVVQSLGLLHAQIESNAIREKNRFFIQL